MSDTPNSQAAAPTTPEAKPTGSATQPNPAPVPQTQSPAQLTALKAQLDRDKALRSREQALKQSEERFRSLEALEKSLRDNPLEALSKYGHSYDELTKRVSAGERPDPVAPVKTELDELRAELKAVREREELQRHETILAEERTRVRGLVDKSDEFSGIKAAEAHDVVFDYMLNHYNSTGEMLDWNVAAKQINENLVALAKKLSPLVAPSTPAAPKHEEDRDATITAGMRSPSAQTRVEQKPFSLAEVNRQAAAMLRLKQE